METVIIVLLVIVIVLLIYNSLSIRNKNFDENNIAQKITSGNQMIREIIMQQQKIQTESALDLSSSLKDSLHNMGMELLKNSSDEQRKMQEIVIKSLQDIQNANDNRLQDIQKNVNEKLDKSLNERLDLSFKQIGDQLSTLYKSIGELQSLSTGVADLQKTLSNVKTRGIFGELQLENILMDIMDASQYEKMLLQKVNQLIELNLPLKYRIKKTPGLLYIYLLTLSFHLIYTTKL